MQVAKQPRCLAPHTSHRGTMETKGTVENTTDNQVSRDATPSAISNLIPPTTSVARWRPLHTEPHYLIADDEVMSRKYKVHKV